MNEDDVITGVINFLKDKHSPRKCKLNRAQAKDGDHGIDLKLTVMSGDLPSSRYYVEAKGTLKVKDNSDKSSDFMKEFRWAISQIILQMKEVNEAAIYAIAIPRSEKDRCLKLIQDNTGLKKLKVWLFLAYKAENGEYYAEEMTPKCIYN